MNRANILTELIEILSGIDLHKSLVDEIIDIIAKSGNELQIFKQFKKLLRILLDLGVNAIQHLEFERLNEAMYSMHIDGKGYNLRILYAFLPSGSPTLLLCFYERGGKRVTDYTTYIDPAKTRLKERLEATENGE